MATPIKIKAGQLTLTGSAQQLLPAELEGAHTIVVRAQTGNSTRLVYLGPAGVTTSTGYELAASESVALDLLDPTQLFVIGTAADKVSWLILR